MKKICIATLLFFLCSGPGWACLNYYYSVDRQGHLHLAEEIRAAFNTNFDKQRNVRLLQQLEKKLKKGHDYTLLSDYAVGLMKLGKLEQALLILENLYQLHPDEYRIATNLGTAYELTGDNASALIYIKRGLQLNPDDHEGSEWIHVKILEAKLALDKDPQYLGRFSVLQLSDKQENDSIVCRHISIQVRERFPFSPGPDPIMASLMQDLGDCYANTISVEYARAVYEIASEYYGDKSEALREKIREMRSLTNNYLSVKPKPGRGKLLMEGEHNKVSGYFSYKRLLDDNDNKHYKIDWSKVNTDVSDLLSMADMTLKTPMLRYAIKKDTGTIKQESARSMVEKVSFKPEEKAAEHKQRTISWYLWILTIAGSTSIVLVFVKFLNNRPRTKLGQASKG